jgi:hypothetical protein
LYFHHSIINLIFINNFKIIFWGLGIGDWGLGIGDWGVGPIPNPQSPIPIAKYFNYKNYIYFNFK